LGFVLREELAQALALAAQSGDGLLLPACLEAALNIINLGFFAAAASFLSIVSGVGRDLLFEFGFELLELVPQIAKGDAVFPGSVGRQLESIEAEVAATQQSLFVADQQHFAKDCGDPPVELAHKISEGAVI